MEVVGDRRVRFDTGARLQGYNRARHDSTAGPETTGDGIQHVLEGWNIDMVGFHQDARQRIGEKFANRRLLAIGDLEVGAPVGGR